MFSRSIAELTGPIRDLLNVENMWTWGAVQQKAFKKMTEELGSLAVLAPYCTVRLTRMSADASSYGLDKPLISLLSSRALDDLPTHVLQFRLGLLRFTYTIMYMLGKNLVAADALSRALLQCVVMEEDFVLESDVMAHITMKSFSN